MRAHHFAVLLVVATLVGAASSTPAQDAGPLYGDIILADEEAYLDLRADAETVATLFREVVGLPLPEVVEVDRWLAVEDLWFRLEPLTYREGTWTRFRLRVGSFQEAAQHARAEEILTAMALRLEALQPGAAAPASEEPDLGSAQPAAQAPAWGGGYQPTTWSAPASQPATIVQPVVVPQVVTVWSYLPVWASGWYGICSPYSWDPYAYGVWWWYPRYVAWNFGFRYGYSSVAWGWGGSCWPWWSGSFHSPFGFCGCAWCSPVVIVVDDHDHKKNQDGDDEDSGGGGGDDGGGVADGDDAGGVGDDDDDGGTDGDGPGRTFGPRLRTARGAPDVGLPDATGTPARGGGSRGGRDDDPQGRDERPEPATGPRIVSVSRRQVGDLAAPRTISVRRVKTIPTLPPAAPTLRRPLPFDAAAPNIPVPSGLRSTPSAPFVPVSGPAPAPTLRSPPSPVSQPIFSLPSPRGTKSTSGRGSTTSSAPSAPTPTIGGPSLRLPVGVPAPTISTSGSGQRGSASGTSTGSRGGTSGRAGRGGSPAAGGSSGSRGGGSGRP